MITLYWLVAFIRQSYSISENWCFEDQLAILFEIMDVQHFRELFGNIPSFYIIEQQRLRTEPQFFCFPLSYHQRALQLILDKKQQCVFFRII